MRQRCLRDDQWDWIKDILPGRAGSVGVTAADNRRFVDAVLYRYRTGIPLARPAGNAWRLEQHPPAFQPLGHTRRLGKAAHLVGG